MTREEKEIIFNRLLELEERHPAFAGNVRDNAYCEAIADVKRIIERINEPSLPSNLDEAAEEELDDVDANWQIDERDDGCTEPGYNQKQMLLMFKAGAEWMAGQGVSIERRVDDFGDGMSIMPPTEMELESVGVGLSDKVIVQIRKK